MSETVTQAPAPAPEAGPSGGPEPRVRLPLAVLAVVATVVVALLLVALAVRLDADRLPSGPPRDPPAGPTIPTRMTVEGRSVTFRELSLTLPDAPYRCPPESPSPVTAFDQIVSCNVVVHEDYDGAGSDWAAVAGVALVDESVGSADDLQGSARAVFDALVELGYTAADRASVSRLRTDQVAVPVPGDAYATQSGRVTVQRKGLPTPYDQLVVVLVRLPSGERVAYFSDFPHDGSKQALSALTASVGSLRLG